MSNNISPRSENNPNPQINITIDGQPIYMQPIDMIDPAVRRQLAARVAEAQAVVVHDWDCMAGRDDDVVRALLQLASSVASCQYMIGWQSWDNPLSATLAIPVTDVAQADRVMQLAILAASFAGGETTTHAEAIRRWRQFHNLPCDTPRSLARRIREASSAGGAGNNGGAVTPQALADLVLGHMQEMRVNRGEEITTPPAWYWKGRFYKWGGQIWEQMVDEETETTRMLQLVAPTTPITSGLIASVVKNMKAKVQFVAKKAPVYVVEEDRFQDVQALVTANCVLDFAAVTTRPHDPRLFAIQRIPHPYDAHAECPLWLETLEGIFPQEDEDDHRIEVIQEFFGYVMMTWDFASEKAMILTGDGSSGKSTILDALEYLVGAANVSAVPLEAFGDSFRMYDMYGKMVNIAREMERASKFQEGVFKGLVSGEATLWNQKNLPTFSAPPTAKLIFATNHLPTIADVSRGMWRRLIVVPCLRSFEETGDIYRKQRLRAEITGILRWALDGAIRLRQQQCFTSCGVCERQLQDYQVDSDPFRQFMDECCLLEPELTIPKQAIYDAYRDYCEGHGRGAKAANAFGRQLLALPGVAQARPQDDGERRARTYVYTGVGLREGVVENNLTRRRSSRPRARQ